MRSVYDVQNHAEEQDLTTTSGFFRLLLLVLTLKEGALYYGGHPCNSMVWICRLVNQRSRESPWGDESSPSASTEYGLLDLRQASYDHVQHAWSLGVKKANCICARFCMLLYLATVRHAFSAIEQPISSMLKCIPHLRRILDRCVSPDVEWTHCSLFLG